MNRAFLVGRGELVLSRTLSNFLSVRGASIGSIRFLCHSPRRQGRQSWPAQRQDAGLFSDRCALQDGAAVRCWCLGCRQYAGERFVHFRVANQDGSFAGVPGGASCSGHFASETQAVSGRCRRPDRFRSRSALGQSYTRRFKDSARSQHGYSSASLWASVPPEESCHRP